MMMTTAMTGKMTAVIQKRRTANDFMLIASIVIISVLPYGRSQDFGYDGEKGPSHWGEQYNSCTGKHQSPININSLYVKKVSLPQLVFDGFDIVPKQVNITNNGHTVTVTVKSDHIPTISGGPLHGVYQYSQLHFHWGDNDTFGSEDMIDNHISPMELHMVFFKQEYKNAKTAQEHPDGLTVLAFFYEIAGRDNPNYQEFIELLGKVTASHNSATFRNPPSLKQLITHDVVHYYTYNGSLTTPPCSEVVTWIDFKEPIMLSHAQIEAFRALEDEEGHPLTHNFRSIQPLGDRVVLFNTDEILKVDVDLTKYSPPNPAGGGDSNELAEKETHETFSGHPFGSKQGKNGGSNCLMGSSSTVILPTLLASCLANSGI
ncbi:carbonic anhydrase 7-like [Uranotaenia lowii]|uniref:carbonic anhydrase 7-like n=1 Tax=Uranotaenia lowii TaxID=190385 RepID=UPI002479FC23|nr:carbonic anhydrase 7-like [Uranotaenia lowii]